MLASGRQFRILLGLLVALNLVNGWLLAIIVPLWVGPDELAHYGYVRHLHLHRSLPDQRTCFISEELKGSTYDANWWGLLERHEKVAPGPGAFYTHGFSSFGEAGKCSLCKTQARSGKCSLAISYDFTPKSDEDVCAYKANLDISRADGIGMWIHGDASNVTLRISFEAPENEERFVQMPVRWAGWLRVFEPFSDFSGGLTEHRSTCATLKIYVADDGISRKTVSGTLFVDDIWLRTGNKIAPLTGFEPEELPITDSEWPNWCAHHPPLYYLLMLPIDVILGDRPIGTRVLAMRLLSVILSTFTIIIAALTGKLLFGVQSPTWLLVPAILLFSPLFTFDQACINNDHLLIPMYALFLYLTLKWSETPLTHKRVIALGVIVGLGILTKLLFLTAVPLVFLLVWLKERGHGLKSLKSASHKLALFTMVLAAVCGWWFVRNCVLYGLPIVTATTFRPEPRLPVPIGLVDILGSESFRVWLTTGWFFRIASHTSFTPSETSRNLTYFLFELAGVGLLRAIVVKLFRKRRLLKPQTAKRLRWLAYAVMVHASIVFSQIAHGTMAVGKFRAFNGRYLLPVGIGMGAFFAFSIQNLLPRRFQRLGVLLAVGLLIVIELLTVHLTMMEVCYPF